MKLISVRAYSVNDGENRARDGGEKPRTSVGDSVDNLHITTQ